MRKLIAHTMPLPEETCNTARPTKRKLIGAHEAALRDNKGVTKRTPQGWR
jgi:hypothetical protein